MGRTTSFASVVRNEKSRCSPFDRAVFVPRVPVHGQTMDARGRELPVLQSGLLYVADLYNETRTHLGLGKDPPLGRAVQRTGTIVTTPILSGLHHRYARI